MLPYKKSSQLGNPFMRYDLSKFGQKKSRRFPPLRVTRPVTWLPQSSAGGQGPFFEVTRPFGQEQ